MKTEKELRQLFKNRSDCYTQLTEGGLKELVVEQALTEDGFINILNELERKKKETTSEQLEHEALLEIGDRRINRIIQEKDPIKREVWAHGYTYIKEDIVQHKILLVNVNKEYIKEIPLDEWRQCLMTLKYCVGTDLVGGLHKWIKEADGSADKFRKLIVACF